MKREELLDRVNKIRELENRRHEEINSQLYSLLIDILEEEGEDDSTLHSQV